ncbi:MAG: UbiX family flavin prenyltransferase [Thermoguttaceae bacterium]
MKRKFILAVTGASGAAYAVRLLDVLSAAGCDVHVTISPAAALVLRQELDLEIDLADPACARRLVEEVRQGQGQLLERVRNLTGISSRPATNTTPGEIVYHHHQDLMAPIASGSFLTDGMVICPCSGGTLSSVVHGISANLVHRAAEVQLKERRPLILVPRETPLSATMLANMLAAAQAGAVILPAMPGFYHGVSTVQDLVDFVVARICDQLRVPNTLIQRWGETP